MKTIFKYPFEIADLVTVEMPRGAQILSIQAQDGDPMLWALVDTEAPGKQYRFRVFGTGRMIVDGYNDTNYRTTFQHGPFVWHVFDWEPLEPSDWGLMKERSGYE